MSGLRIEGTDELQRIANALKAAGEKDLQRRVSAAIRGEAKPLGERVLRRAAEGLPKRGGLSGRVAGEGRVGVSASLRGRMASVTVLLKHKAADLKSMDSGVLRHPVFARGDRTRKEWTWVRQEIPAGLFSKAFNEESEEVRAAVLVAAKDALGDIARKA